MDDSVDPDLIVDTRHPTEIVALIALGGVLGTLARAAVGAVLPTHAGRFPWGTFVVNVTGAFVLGILATWFAHRRPGAQGWRAFAVTGFCGAYTTFSTFVVEADRLGRGGTRVIALGYVLGSVAAGLLAVWGAQRLTRRWLQ